MQDAPMTRYAARANATRPKIPVNSNPVGIGRLDELCGSGDALSPVAGPFCFCVLSCALSVFSEISGTLLCEQGEKSQVALGNRISFSIAGVTEHVFST